MSELIGFVYAFIAVITWGTFLVPFKKIKADVYYSQFLMCLGIFIPSMIISVVLNFPLNLTFLGLSAGIIWTVGNFLCLLAIEDIGISRANPLWMVNILVGSAFGIVLFRELTGFMSIVFGLAGVLCIFTGCVLIGRTKKEEEESKKRGIAFAILAGLFFGCTYVPLKITGMTGSEYFFQMSIGIILTSFIIFLLKRPVPKKLQIKKGLASGTLWAIGNLFGAYTVVMFGMSRGFPLTQLAVLISAAWGLFYFKEFTQKKQIVRIMMSTVIILAGAFLIGLAGG